jgi:plastocyanin
VAERRVLVGFLPESIVIDAGDQVEWISNAGNIKAEFDAARSPFGSNVFQAPAGVRLLTGPTKPGMNPGSYKYKLSFNDVVVGQGEVIIRGK